MSDWPLLELPHDVGEDELVEFCWRYFQSTYLRKDSGEPIEVIDWRGCRVVFSRFAFNHIISGSSDYRAGLGNHDVGFVPARAERLPWIGLALAGDGEIEVRHQERQSSRGKRLRRRILVVVDRRYLVVLDRQDDGSLRLRTAFPVDAAYLAHVAKEGALVETRHKKEESPSLNGD